jgi:glycosyltransferase involved in cell wall biosynthesis
MQHLRYALITPARNEEAFIEKTIRSVTTQTILPKRWVIVSDGSTDRTDSIVKGYLGQNPWMELVRMSEHRDRHFGAKVSAFNAGYYRLNGIAYDIIGNLDGDISFEPGYIEYLLDQFAQNPQLGVAGTPFIEEKNSSGYNYNFANIEHVSGACQLFRRQCFEEIGGYISIKGGGIDWVAVTIARMKGWKTWTFTEKTCFHHRPMGTGGHSVLKARFKLGKEDYYLGGHPLWAFFRSIFQMKEKPYLIGGLLIFSGYLWGALTRVKRPLSEDLVSFHRKEQMGRLKKIFGRMLRASRR